MNKCKYQHTNKYTFNRSFFFVLVYEPFCAIANAKFCATLRGCMCIFNDTLLVYIISCLIVPLLSDALFYWYLWLEDLYRVYYCVCLFVCVRVCVCVIECNCQFFVIMCFCMWDHSECIREYAFCVCVFVSVIVYLI